MSLGERSLAALAILVAVAVFYGVMGAAGLVPLPASLAHLSQRQQIGHTRVLVSGFYVTQYFIALGGASLPPYVFASGTQKDAPGVRVAPMLPDVAAGRVAAVIDTATGDGSEASPYVIYTLAKWDAFVSAMVVGTLIVVAFAFWLAGTVVALLHQRG